MVSYRGVAVAPGATTGRMVWAEGPDDYAVVLDGVGGEPVVLVTSMVSPDVTNLGAVIVALVMKEGHLLSHGAVLARELGIPAVTRIEIEALRHEAEGRLLHVDGGSGMVTILDDEAPHG